MLTLREILKSNFAYTAISDDFKKSNVLPVDNSKEDLKSLAIENDNDLNGHLSYDDEDLKIQKEFWNIYLRFADKKKIGNFQPRISPSFLRKNLDLLN